MLEGMQNVLRSSCSVQPLPLFLLTSEEKSNRLQVRLIENDYHYCRRCFLVDTLMIVGADKLGSIPKRLQEVGFQDISHVSGRKVKMVQKNIPEDVDLVLILTDFINHNMTDKVKEKAKEQNVPVCFAKRSWCSIYKTLANCEEVCRKCPMLQGEE
ncbi:DUF2325 domain-containing protein [Salibacterium sp. K-3]